MVKRTKLSEYKLQRYSKPVTNIKLKDNDTVTNVCYNNMENVLITTNNGYSLMFNINDVPITGVKSSGVKSINLKDDFVTNATLFDDSYEYVSIFTNKGTAKRVRISDLEYSTRAKRGILILREVKTNPHKVVKSLVMRTNEMLGLKDDTDIKMIKNSELSIMDRYSTGSSVSKKITDVFKEQVLESESTINKSPIKKEVKEVSLEDIDSKMLTIDDFLKDTKIM